MATRTCTNRIWIRGNNISLPSGDWSNAYQFPVTAVSKVYGGFGTFAINANYKTTSGHDVFYYHAQISETSGSMVSGMLGLDITISPYWKIVKVKKSVSSTSQYRSCHIGTIGGISGGETNTTVRLTSSFDNTELANTTEATSSSASIDIYVERVTFNITAIASPTEGGTASTSASSVVAGNTITLTATAAPGYEFLKWTDPSGNDLSTSAVYEFEPSASGNYTANFNQLTYYVSFNPNGGTCTWYYKTIHYNDTFAGKLPTATRDGAVFQGWFTAAVGGTKVTEQSTYTWESNVTLFAHWTGEYTEKIYAIFQAPSYATVSQFFREVTTGSTYGALPTVTYDTAAYAFTGWYDAETGGNQVTASTVVRATATHNLYARFTEGMTISYVDPTGTNQTVTAYMSRAAQITLRGIFSSLNWIVPTGASYSLSAMWRMDTGTTYADGATVQLDFNYGYTKTFYANWTTAVLTITLNGNGGTPETQTVTRNYGAYYGSLPNPTKSGAVFLGWYTATSGGTRVEDNTVCTASTTLYAIWSDSPGVGGVDWWEFSIS